MERRRLRKEAEESKMQSESKDSYLNVDQFKFLHNKIEIAHKKLKEQQLCIDGMEQKMIDHLIKRANKQKDKQDANNVMTQVKAGSAY